MRQRIVALFASFVGWIRNYITQRRVKLQQGRIARAQARAIWLTSLGQLFRRWTRYWHLYHQSRQRRQRIKRRARRLFSRRIRIRLGQLMSSLIQAVRRGRQAIAYRLVNAKQALSSTARNGWTRIAAMTRMAGQRLRFGLIWPFRQIARGYRATRARLPLWRRTAGIWFRTKAQRFRRWRRRVWRNFRTRLTTARKTVAHLIRIGWRRGRGWAVAAGALMVRFLRARLPEAFAMLAVGLVIAMLIGIAQHWTLVWTIAPLLALLSAMAIGPSRRGRLWPLTRWRLIAPVAFTWAGLWLIVLLMR